MKISKKLKSQLREHINGVITNHLIHLDMLDRSNQISHKAWQLVHQPACDLASTLENEVIRVIESYGR